MYTHVTLLFTFIFRMMKKGKMKTLRTVERSSSIRSVFQSSLFFLMHLKETFEMQFILDIQFKQPHLINLIFNVLHHYTKFLRNTGQNSAQGFKGLLVCENQEN